MPKRIFQAGGGGKKGFAGFPISQFVGLGDAPHDYSGAASKFVTVNPAENGLEFTPLPPLAITDTLVVASEAAMLALTVQRGDVAIRTDISQSFILAADDPTILANWTMLLVSATSAVLNGTTPPPSPIGVSDGTLYIQHPDKWFLTALYEEMRKTKNGTTLLENLDFHDFDTDILLENGSWYAMASHGMQICLGGNIDGVNSIITSLDGGITWTKTKDDNLFDFVSGLAFGNGVWVAAGQGTNSMAYSVDGRHWVGLGVDNPLNQAYCVKFNGSVFVAGGAPNVATDPVLIYSTDGITWHNSDLAGSASFNNATSICWDGTKWFANTSYIVQDMAYSTNGINWTQYTPNGIDIAYALSFEYGSPVAGTPVYVLVGRSAAGHMNSIAYSYDAISWISLGVTKELRLDQVAWDGSLFVAVSSDQTINSLVYSPDGVNWTGAGIILPYGGYQIGVCRTNNTSYPVGVYICNNEEWIKTTMF